MTATDLNQGVRASNLVGCLRKGYYDAIEVEKEELPKKIRRLWKIRAMQNDAIALEKKEEAEAGGRVIVLEQAIPWGPVTADKPRGVWEGHADYVDETDHLVVELTGSADLSPDRRKMLQAAFYAKRKTEITGVEYGAWVFVFNPSTGEDRWVPINWREIVWEIDVLIADLQAYLATGEEPPRRDSAGEVTCESPHDGPAMFCPYAMYCFREWEYPPVGKLTGAPAKLAAEVLDLQQRSNTKLLDEDRKAKSRRLATLIEPKAKYRVPLEDGKELEVSYSEIPGRVTVSLSEMEAAGFKLPAELERFVKRGDPSVRINTKVVEVPSS